MRSRSLVLGTLVLMAALLLPAGPASAAFTSGVASGALTITMDSSGGSVSPTCNAGNLKLNGLDPGTGPATCASITSITFQGGDANDSFSAFFVTVANFPAITSVVVNGGDGIDFITGTEYGDQIDGGPGRDTIQPNAGADIVEGGSGNEDTFTFAGAGPLVVTDTGTTSPSGNDTLSGIELANLYGLSGNDTIDASGFSGPLRIGGSTGNDTLTGGPEDDVIDGGVGTNTVNGGSGDDVMSSISGVGSTLNGGPGVDQVQGDGVDLELTDTTLISSAVTEATFSEVEEAAMSFSAAGTLDASTSTMPVTVNGSSTTASVTTGSGDDTITAGFDGGVIESGGGNDTVTGRGADDEIHGGGGGDEIVGGDGNDMIFGDGGGDDLTGDGDDDTVKGGDGKDDLDGSRGTDDCKGNAGKDTIKRCE